MHDTKTRTRLDDAFDQLAAAIRTKLQANQKVFTTNAGDRMAEAFLSGFDDPAVRQFFNCSCCKSFLRRYGALATLENNVLTPLLWTEDVITYAPHEMRKAVRQMANVVRTARIDSIFVTRDAVLGSPETNGYDHFYLDVPVAMRSTDRLKTPGQLMADRRVEFVALKRGMLEFSDTTFAAAATLLATANLATDSFLNQARALQAIKAAFDAPTNARDIPLWQAMANSRPGTLSFRSSALGTLLVDLQAGMDGNTALRRFAVVVDPMRYQVKSTPVGAGNVRQAEDIIAKLGLAPALERRYASLEEVARHAIWAASSGPAGTVLQETAKPAGGVFGHLTGQGQPDAVNLGAGKAMTWEQFVRKVLPTATHIQVVPSGDGTYGAITAPVHADAPPLFFWDNDGARNPYSWYRWQAAAPDSFGVTGPTSVIGAIPLPAMWGGGTQHKGVVLVLAGAQDANAAQATLGLYAPLLRPEVHPVRHTIQAHSAARTLGPAPAGPAAVGLVLRQGFARATLRVSTGNVARDYVINGWE